MKYKIVFEETVTYNPINVDASGIREALKKATEALDSGYIDVVETDTVVTEMIGSEADETIDVLKLLPSF
tara:strand:+ start:522 stop:731 length:210 start_codon:yes stop_codon:yes gene_type:complete